MSVRIWICGWSQLEGLARASCVSAIYYVWYRATFCRDRHRNWRAHFFSWVGLKKIKINPRAMLWNSNTSLKTGDANIYIYILYKLQFKIKITFLLRFFFSQGTLHINIPIIFITKKYSHGSVNLSMERNTTKKTAKK